MGAPTGSQIDALHRDRRDRTVSNQLHRHRRGLAAADAEAGDAALAAAGHRPAALRSASFIRVCQPGPVARK